jgi:hypothetical protein
MGRPVFYLEIFLSSEAKQEKNCAKTLSQAEELNKQIHTAP